MKQIQAWLAGVAATLGPWGILLVALVDSAFIPLPQGVDALLIAQAIAAPSTAYVAAGLAVIGVPTHPGDLDVDWQLASLADPAVAEWVASWPL